MRPSSMGKPTLSGRVFSHIFKTLFKLDVSVHEPYLNVPMLWMAHFDIAPFVIIFAIDDETTCEAFAIVNDIDH